MKMAVLEVTSAHNDLKYELNSHAYIYYAYVINSSYNKKKVIL